jgi:transposase-like protein
MGRRGYPPEFHRKVLDLLEAGRSVADVARDLEISDQSIYTWRRQTASGGSGPHRVVRPRR